MKNIKKILLSLMVTVTMMLSLSTTNVFAVNGGPEAITIELTENLPSLEIGKTYDPSIPYTIGTMKINGTDASSATNLTAKLVSGKLPEGMRISSFRGLIILVGTPTKNESCSFSLMPVYNGVERPANAATFAVAVTETADTNSYAFKSTEFDFTLGSNSSCKLAITGINDEIMADKKFSGIKIDGNVLKESDYVKQGFGVDDSHLFLIYASFLNTLSVGEHEVTVQYGEKETEFPLSFTILKEAKKAAFTAGANATWNKGSTKSLVFKTNSTTDNLVAFNVDGKAIDTDHITVDDSTGSLVVTMKPAYLQGLKTGKHKLEIVYTDILLTTNFTIKSGSPKTDDTTNVAYLMGMLGMSALAAYVIRKKKYNN